MKLGQHVGIGAVRRLSSLGRAGTNLLPKDAMLLGSCESRCVRVLRSLPRVCAYAEVAVRPRPSSALTRRHSCSKIDHPPRRPQVSSPRAQLEITVILRSSRVATLSRKSLVLPGDVISTRSFSSGARAKSSSAAAAAARGLKDRNRKVAMYMATVVTAVLGVSYAAVPLYKAFCQMTGFGGTTQVADEDKALKMKPVEGGRIIRVTFDGGTADTMPWKFRPTQSDVKVVPGETALAFFTAKNPSSKHITGVATYNVFPLKAGIYFNKIQCFCFEEQRLRAGEEIDMPVFFFLDPEMLDDPTMDNVNNVTLSYTFFQTAEEEARPEEEEEDEGEKEGENDQIM